jgi:hypothetical protein
MHVSALTVGASNASVGICEHACVGIGIGEHS